MSTTFRLMASILSRLASTYPESPKARVVRESLQDLQRREPGTGAPARIAIQSVEDPFYLALFGAIVAELKRRRAVVAELVVVRAVNGAIGTGWPARVRRSLPLTWLLSTQWVRAFSGLADGVAFRSHSWRHPLLDGIDWFRSVALWRRVRDKQGDLVLDVGGVAVGDLISDSYLRFRPAPEFVASDPFVLQLIWQAHRAVRRARRYFAAKAPTAYLTSYTTYLEHGIPVRVALQEGVKVYSFGSLARFSKELTLADWFHTADCRAFRSDFDALDDQERRLAEAEHHLRMRLSGGIDPATSYMRVSAYAGSGADAPADMAGSVVVFLHDFYDSPHIYADIVFGDFWTWVCFTIDTLSQAGIPFYLKPHPNQVALSAVVLQRLKARYPQVRFIPQGVTNAQLAGAGLACGVTVYGTVAHELAYLGIPSVACARHPHIAFDFCRTARTPEGYAELLRSARDLPRDVASMRRQALAFYYMYNLSGTVAERDLRQRFVELWKRCQSADSTPVELAGALASLRNAETFTATVARLL